MTQAKGAGTNDIRITNKEFGSGKMDSGGYSSSDL